MLNPLKIHLLFVFLILIIHNGFSQTRNGKDYALFFANSDYSSNTHFNNLKNPIKDTRAIAEELKDIYGFETIVFENYTKTQIYEVLDQWQKRSFGPNDQVFLFFSGHGTFWEFTKTGYYVPNTANTEYSGYIELPALGNIVTQIPCRHILLAIDACYSGTIDQEIAFRGDGARRPGENNTTDRKNIIERQLRNQSRLLITSGGKQRTPDGHDHSPFTEALLDALRSAYTYGDGLVTFADLVGKLERVTPTPHQGELPQHDQGGFVFVAHGRTELVTIKPINTMEKETSPNRSSYNMVLVKGGSFQMGSNEGESDEKPVHPVTLSDYYIGRFEVTFEEYDAFCTATNRDLPYDQGWGRSNRPVMNVSWLDAIEYCNWLSEQHNYQPVYNIMTGINVQVNWKANGYRLPTEAEWEFAARSRGKDKKWAGISSESHLTIYANGKGEHDGYTYTAPVGSLRANDLDLFDMSGNVWEWCWDWAEAYPHFSQNNPKGPDRGHTRIRRGGSWSFKPNRLLCTNRSFKEPGYKGRDVGFRLSRSTK